MENNKYWEDRIAVDTWNNYNNLEKRNLTLLDMYRSASENIISELYRLSEKLGTNTFTRSDMYKFDRLSKLQRSINEILKDLGSKSCDLGVDMLKNGYKTNYINVMKALNISFNTLNDRVINHMVNQKWLGFNFSERVWNNTKILAGNVDTILKNGIIQGKSVTQMAVELNNTMNEGFNNAHRLIRTETMHTLNESSFNAYKDSGVVEKVEVLVALDERLCKRCGPLNGQKYDFDKRPLLPVHPNCRCTYIPVIGDIKQLTSNDTNKYKKNIEEKKNTEEKKNKEIEKRKKELERIKDGKTPNAKRHRLKSINAKSATKPKNTIMLPRVDYHKDIEDIKKGLYNKVGESFEINGRLYSFHNNIFYPESGDGFITLNIKEYNLLKVMKTQANSPKLDEILNNLKATEEEVKKIKDILKHLEE